MDTPAEEQQEPDHPADNPIEEQPANTPVEDAEQHQNPGNPNPLPVQPPIPLANNQLNWSHFRPEFSGTPNEDADAHLLRTEDLMTTHNFPEDHKVWQFCLTLTGEARLWYATLNVQHQQLNWDSLWERFRQQYSKFGNTGEQYFHAWRSFQFDEATDTIDGYIQKVKQVAALLDYGNPHILELLKNTLPSRLYYMLYHIDNLREAVEMAKRVLAKEQMDKKTGQSSTSPFMQISQSSSNNRDKAEKKVSFSAVEAMEWTTESIERLASLMDRMDTRLDRREDQYSPRVYQGRSRRCGYRQNNYGSRNRSYSWDWYQITIEEGETITIEAITEVIDPITEITVGPEIGTATEMAVGIIIDQITEETMAIKGTVIEAKIVVDLGTETEEIEVAPEKVLNLGVVHKTGTKVEDTVEMIPGLGTDLNLDLDPHLVWVQIETEVDVIDAMSMITLPKNVLIVMPKVEISATLRIHFWEWQMMIQLTHSVIQMEKILT